MKSKSKKILVIRFNSIGDIVLSSPVIKILNEEGHQVHFLIKQRYHNFVKYNPHIERIWTLNDSLKELITDLEGENFDLIVDLHNNYRSFKVKQALNVKSYSFKKDHLKYWMFFQLGIDKIDRRPIVHKFLETIKPIINHERIEAPEFYYPVPSEEIMSDLPERYIVIVVGAGFKTKLIPENLIKEIIKGLNISVVLLGGTEDEERGRRISMLDTKDVWNFCGKKDIIESAQIIEKAELVVSGDTGLMHIAAALNRPLIALFGSTDPTLGYAPYGFDRSKKIVIIQNEDLSCRPCTKQGRKICPKGHYKCMLDLNSSQIIEKIKALI